MKTRKLLFVATLLTLAISACKKETKYGTSITPIKNVVNTIFSPLYQLAVGLAFIYFLFGVFRFIIDMNDPERKNIGKGHLLWGLLQNPFR